VSIGLRDKSSREEEAFSGKLEGAQTECHLRRGANEGKDRPTLSRSELTFGGIDARDPDFSKDVIGRSKKGEESVTLSQRKKQKL